jgi:hypothetical protein
MSDQFVSNLADFMPDQQGITNMEVIIRDRQNRSTRIPDPDSKIHPGLIPDPESGLYPGPGIIRVWDTRIRARIPDFSENSQFQ